MSANLLNDVWDDTELVRLYEESTNRITEALISRANLIIPEDNDDSNENIKGSRMESDGELDGSSQSDGEMNEDDNDDGEIREDEEEGEIRDKKIFSKNKKRSVDVLEVQENEKVENKEDSGEILNKKLKTEDQVPNTTQPQENCSTVIDNNDSSQLLHPSQITDSLIQQQNYSVNSHTVIKQTLNATLGSYFQAGCHARSLENCLGLDKGSLQVPMNSLVSNSSQISDKLNSALISYWQMGYYNSLCEKALPVDKE